MSQLAPQFEQLPGREQERMEARERVVEYLEHFIANINSGALGVTGMIALVLVAIGLLSTMEASFNDIWGIRRGRSWISRVIHYWTAITLGPLVVFVALSVAVKYISSRRARWGRTALNGSLFLALILAFALLYRWMPDTKVSWKAVLVGGFVGAILWVLNSRFNVLFASRVVSASSIYGSLAVFPVFLIGMYISWMILLFGAQVAYAFQYRHACVQEKRIARVNQRGASSSHCG